MIYNRFAILKQTLSVVVYFAINIIRKVDFFDQSLTIYIKKKRQ